MKVLLASVLMAASALAQRPTQRPTQQGGLQSSDYLKLRSVGSVQFSPDAARLAYTVENNDGPGRPYSQIWIMNVADGKSIRLGGEKERTSGPEVWPTGEWIAYHA